MVIRFLALVCFFIAVDVLAIHSASATPRRFEYTNPGANNSAPGDDDQPHVEAPGSDSTADGREPAAPSVRDRSGNLVVATRPAKSDEQPVVDWITRHLTGIASVLAYLFHLCGRNGIR
jgi:hypothetical protein